jgi:hypothetical protein
MARDSLTALTARPRRRAVRLATAGHDQHQVFARHHPVASSGDRVRGKSVSTPASTRRRRPCASSRAPSGRSTARWPRPHRPAFSTARCSRQRWWPRPCPLAPAISFADGLGQLALRAAGMAREDIGAESQIIATARHPTAIWRHISSSKASPTTGSRSILKSPECTTRPAGVSITSAGALGDGVARRGRIARVNGPAVRQLRARRLHHTHLDRCHGPLPPSCAWRGSR